MSNNILYQKDREMRELEKYMEEMAKLPRDGRIPKREPGEKCKYEDT